MLLCESSSSGSALSDSTHSDVTTDASVIVINIYDRFADEACPTSGFLGMLEIKPAFVHDSSVDSWYT